MLKQRLLTAAVLIPLVFLAILNLQTSIFQYLLAAVVILASIEWFAIIGIKQTQLKLLASVILLAAGGLSSFMPIINVAVIALVFWGVVSAFVIRFAHIKLAVTLEKCLQQTLIAYFIALVALILFWVSAVNIHQSSALGPQQLLYVMVLVWLADTGGYFAGKRWGKMALAKAISPNKTWEGVAGAVVLGTVWAVIAYLLGIAGELSLVTWLALSFAASLISVVGDLFESVFKRIHQIKDSGNLLPGHGGMLDRIDSLLAAIPVFAAELYFLGVI